jgi:Fur family ferric uptake transcriptional regulator
MTVSDATATARDFLARTGLDPTLNRILVLAAVAGSDRPLTAREVFERVLAEHRINRVTVYRILDLLAENGAVNRISSADRAARFCAGGGRWPNGHSHFHCTRCGEVQCVDNAALHIDANTLKAALPMHVNAIDLRLDGICANCTAEAGPADEKRA